MLKLKRGLAKFNHYRDDDRGNVGLMFAVSAVAVIGCMGAAMDYSTLSNAKSRSQSIADQTALAAAIYVKEHGHSPKEPEKDEDGNYIGPEDGYLDKSNKTYTAAELGHEFKGWVEGGAENVDVEVQYDDTNRQAVVTVSGKTIPTFMQVLGQQNMDFSAQSIVKYQEYEFYDPASIVMVLDNSGSMHFDDKKMVYNEDTEEWEAQEGVQQRLAALKTHSNNFMTKLNTLVGSQAEDADKVLRTGMLTYNETTIHSRTVGMDWRTIPRDRINSMTASGGTNSAPPLDTASLWMSSEDQTHIDMHGDDPLKFLIFMTDGVNSVGGVTWVKEDDTGQWRGQRCGRVKNYRCQWYYWDTVESENKPTYYYSRYWEEGKWEPTANISSVSDCDAMKEDGVKIYSIGFALGQGWYDTNEYYGHEDYDYIDVRTRNSAYNFLSRCASDPSTFLTAENAGELEEAFTTIGNDIMTEIIRLSN